MRVRVDRNAPFQPIRGAAEITGLSTNLIRQGCQNGTIPHIRVGSDYRVDMKLFLDVLHKKAAGGEQV